MTKRWKRVLTPFATIEAEEVGRRADSEDDDEVRFRIAYRLRTERGASLVDIEAFLGTSYRDVVGLFMKHHGSVPKEGVSARLVFA